MRQHKLSTTTALITVGSSLKAKKGRCA